MLTRIPVLAMALAIVPLFQNPATKVEKYPDGSIKSQTTTTFGPDGKTKTHETKTDYDKSGRPTHESDQSFRNGDRTKQVDQTWVYDEKGRLIYYEWSNETPGDQTSAGVLQRYRIRKSYNGDNDTAGTVESEEIYASATGKWREFSDDVGDTRPSMKPVQPLPPPQFPPPTTPLGGSAPKPAGEPPKPKFKLSGKIVWEHTPDETAENIFGFGGEVAFALTSHLNVVGEVARASGSNAGLPVISGATQSDFARLTVMGGAEWDFTPHGRASPFVRAMAGMVHDTTSFLGESFSGSGFAIAFGAGVRFSLRGRLGAIGGFDYMPTHFTDTWQQALMASGGVSYGIGDADGSAGGGAGGAPMTIGLENPYATGLANAQAEVQRTKPASDKAYADIEKCDPAWMKKNLTAEGQKAVEEAKRLEQEAKADFDKATDNLRKAQQEDDAKQTLESGDKLAKARITVKEEASNLKHVHDDRIREIKKGFTKEAKKAWEQAVDAYWQALQKRDELKRLSDKWNKDHGIK